MEQTKVDNDPYVKQDSLDPQEENAVDADEKPDNAAVNNENQQRNQEEPESKDPF